MNSNTPLKLIMGYCVIALLGFVVFLSSFAHCATTSSQKNRTNAFGALSYTSNPFTYVAGSVKSVAYIDGGLVIRVQPLATYSLYTEDILICGSPVDEFLGKTNPLVLVYKTQASRLVQGLGCHELQKVREIKAEKRFDGNF